MEIVKFDEWQKIDLRVAEIINVEDIEGADKLYKLTVDLGKELGRRVICAGIKQHYTKENLKGRKIIVFANLEPLKIRGIESQGMLLAACDDLAKPKRIALLIPDEKKDAGVGDRVS